MNSVTGIVQRRAEEPLWAWPAPEVMLRPDQAVFFLRKRDSALIRVAASGSDPTTVRFEAGCEALVVSRDFGVRIQLPCGFADSVAGTIDAEVRLRLLEHVAEWPRRLPQLAAAGALGETGGPEQALGRLVAALFEAEISGFAAGYDFAEFSRRLNDPGLVADAESRLRIALGRWTDEGIMSLLALHLLGAESPAHLERSRLQQEHARKLLQARQANELAALERERERAAPDEVRWRLFEPADLLPAGARPPRLLKESAAPYDALASGQHLQLVVRPTSMGHVYVLAHGPYEADGAIEYRWLRLFGNEGRSALVSRAPRAGGNRFDRGDTLVFPGDAGAAELFQHYLTLDAAAGWETVVVAITPEPVPAARLEGALPELTPGQREVRGLQALFGTDARIYLFQFFHP